MPVMRGTLVLAVVLGLLVIVADGLALPGQGRVVYQAGVTVPFTLRALDPARGLDLALIDVTFQSASPTWSPDGTQVAFAEVPSGRVGLQVYDLFTGESRQVAPDVLARYPVWSPTSSEILMNGQTGLFDFDLLAVDPLTDETRTLLSLKDTTLMADWSPDGTRVIFVRQYQGDFRWQSPTVLDTRTGELTPLVIRADFVFRPRWSPDGTRIAFVGLEAGHFDLFMLDLIAGETVRLTDHPASDIEPDWSPDGSQVIFVSDRDGIPRLYTYDLASGAVTALPGAATPARQPDWWRRASVD